jgi:isoamylase
MNQSQRKVSVGHFTPLGAKWEGSGVNFAVFSAHATAVEICLFDEFGEQELERIKLPNYRQHTFYGHIDGLSPGTLYGLRVYGPYLPKQGHRFNPNKLLIDPYARQLKGELKWDDSLFGYTIGEGDLSFDTRDSAPYMPKCVVTGPMVSNQPPLELCRRPLTEGLIYEAHVKGLTKLHPQIPPEERGTFVGLAHESVYTHLKKLSVSALELLPIQSFVNDRYLVEKSLSNFWGYQPLCYFAPNSQYMASDRLEELWYTTKKLASEGIEVIMDVVYNHTGEGSELGPTLSFRGIDNASYYSLRPDAPRYYIDDSGCGNRLNVAHPKVLQLVMDSLRYWHHEVGVSGFRFDLCTSLGRGPRGLDMRGGFFATIAQDPTLQSARLIAEPWDVGPGGYQLGSYLNGWSEWNDRFRDTIRRFWRGDHGLRPEVARRLCGSSALYRPKGRSPEASINYLCSHDGATLHDLVTYARKRNDANGENNQDGHHDDLNIHLGGDGEDESLSPLRRRVQRSLLASLFLSRGGIMLLAGDEMGRTQLGNNNAYCQDNELSWVSWNDRSTHDEELIDFVAQLGMLRKRFTPLSSSRWLTGERLEGEICRDLIWLELNGEERQENAWDLGDGLDLYYALAHQDYILLVMMNASNESKTFIFPKNIDGYLLNRVHWHMEINSEKVKGIGTETMPNEYQITVQEKTVLVWSLILP